LSEDLIASIKGITASRKRRGMGQIEYILGVLEQGRPIFANVQNKGVFAAGDISKNTLAEKKIDLRRMDKQEQILKVLSIFINEFETLALPLNVSIKDYVLFLVVCLKLIRKLKASRQQSLCFAQTLATLNQMFVRYPAQYNKRAIKEPLELLFLVTEFANEASQHLETPYEIDVISMSQFATLITKYCANSENPLLEIMKDISEIPKFRLNIAVGQEHQKIIEKILRQCFSDIPVKIRIETTRKLLNKIVSEVSDTSILAHYNTLKLMMTNDDLIEHVSKLVNAEIVKTKHSRFVNGILEELLTQCKKS
jgi:hypothetical protein